MPKEPYAPSPGDVSLLDGITRALGTQLHGELTLPAYQRYLRSAGTRIAIEEPSGSSDLGELIQAKLAELGLPPVEDKTK